MLVLQLLPCEWLYWDYACPCQLVWLLALQVCVALPSEFSLLIMACAICLDDLGTCCAHVLSTDPGLG